MGSKEKLIERMRYWCDQANLGYDQMQRWDIRDGGETDCSALVYHCLYEAGYWKKPDDPYAHTLYTGTLQRDLLSMGFTKLPNDGHPEPGDILLADAHHVAVCTGPGILSQASIDENGRISGGKSGDQTGLETVTRPYYNYPWNNYYRPPAENAPKRKRAKMECIFRPNMENYLVYYDGRGFHPLHHPDEVTAINTVYQLCNDGASIPTFELGTPEAPWATRFMDAASR